MTPRNRAFGDFGDPEGSSPAKNALVAAAVAALVFTLGVQATTQWLAHSLEYQAQLGAPIVEASGGSAPIYAPWKALSWKRRLVGAEGGDELVEGTDTGLRRATYLSLGTGLLTLGMRQRGSRNRIDQVHGSARWAKREEIRRAGLLADEGVVVGGIRDKWYSRRIRRLLHNGPEHILAFAPTASGKGVALVIESLLRWRHSAIILDPKGENFALTSGYRAALGQRVYRLDFAADPHLTAAFNPLGAVRVGTAQEIADAQRLARMIIDPDGRQFEGHNKHWAETGSSLLTGAILHVLYRERQQGRVATLQHVLEELTDRRRSHDDVLRDWLSFPHDPNLTRGWQDEGPSPTHPVVAASAREQLNREQKERTAVLSSAVTPLSVFRDPLLAANTARSDFTLEEIMDATEPVSIYLVLRPSDIHRLRPIVRIFLDLALRRLVETMSFVGGQAVASHRHRLLLMLDEFPVLGKLDVFSESLAYIRGWGIKAYIIAQDYEQLKAAYGDRETISSNCHIKIAFAPTKLETARMLSAMLGTMTVTKHARGSIWGPRNGHETQNEMQRDLMSPNELMRLQSATKKGDRIIAPGAMLTLVAGSYPVRGMQPLFFLDEHMLAKARVPPAACRPASCATIAPATTPGRAANPPPVVPLPAQEKTKESSVVDQAVEDDMPFDGATEEEDDAEWTFHDSAGDDEPS